MGNDISQLHVSCNSSSNNGLFVILYHDGFTSGKVKGQDREFDSCNMVVDSGAEAVGTYGTFMTSEPWKRIAACLGGL